MMYYLPHKTTHQHGTPSVYKCSECVVYLAKSFLLSVRLFVWSFVCLFVSFHFYTTHLATQPLWAVYNNKDNWDIDTQYIQIRLNKHSQQLKLFENQVEFEACRLGSPWSLMQASVPELGTNMPRPYLPYREWIGENSKAGSKGQYGDYVVNKGTSTSCPSVS